MQFLQLLRRWREAQALLKTANSFANTNLSTLFTYVNIVRLILNAGTATRMAQVIMNLSRYDRRKLAILATRGQHAPGTETQSFLDNGIIKKKTDGSFHITAIGYLTGISLAATEPLVRETARVADETPTDEMPVADFTASTQVYPGSVINRGRGRWERRDHLARVAAKASRGKVITAKTLQSLREAYRAAKNSE